MKLGSRSPREVATRVLLEFVVIMAGVLAALAADEWRQTMSERRLSDQYLQRVRRDLETDTATWTGVRRQVEEKLAALDGAMLWVRDPRFAPEPVSQLLEELTIGARLSYGAQTTVAQTTFDELVSTGRMDLIRDITLRRELMAYYYRVDVQRTRVSARETRYAPTIYELIPRDPEFVVAPWLTPSDKERVARRAAELDLESIIIAERNRGRLRIEVADEMLERSIRLLELFAATGVNQGAS